LEKTVQELSLNSSNDKQHQSEELRKLRNVNEGYLKEIDLKNEEIKNLKEKLMSLENEMKKNKEITKKLIDNLKNDLSVKTKAYSELESEIKFFKDDNKELKSTLSKLEMDYKNLKEKYVSEIDKLKLTSQSESSNLTKVHKK